MQKKMAIAMLGTMVALAGCGSSQTVAPETPAETAEETSAETTAEETTEATDEEASGDAETTDVAETEGSEETTTEENAADTEASEDVVIEVGSEISNDLFKITMPEELTGTYEAEVSSDRIDIYYKEARAAGFPGLVFSVWAKELPSEFSGGPYIKKGELKGSKNYDVVMGEPTEIQWDYEVPEAPEAYTALLDAADSVFETLEGLNGLTYTYGAGTKGADLYADVIAKYVTAINENWDANKLEEEKMTPELVALNADGKGLENVCYAFGDFDVNGIDELYIGEKGELDAGSTIFDIYTMVDGEPASVVSGSARDRYCIINDSFIMNEYSGGAAESGWNVYALNDNSTDITLQYGYKYDAYEDEEKPWFSTYDGENFEAITEDEFNEAMNAASKHTELDLTPISKFGK